MAPFEVRTELLLPEELQTSVLAASVGEAMGEVCSPSVFVGHWFSETLLELAVDIREVVVDVVDEGSVPSTGVKEMVVVTVEVLPSPEVVVVFEEMVLHVVMEVLPSLIASPEVAIVSTVDFVTGGRSVDCTSLTACGCGGGGDSRDGGGDGLVTDTVVVGGSPP